MSAPIRFFINLPPLGPVAVGDELWACWPVRYRAMSPCVVKRVGPKWITVDGIGQPARFSVLDGSSESRSGLSPQLRSAAQLTAMQQYDVLRERMEAVCERTHIQFTSSRFFDYPTALALVEALEAWATPNTTLEPR